MRNLFKTGDIVVATSSQTTGCGIKYINAGSILEIAKDQLDWRMTIDVYRNQKAKAEGITHSITISKLRVATAAEEEAYEKGIYFVELINA